MNDRAEGVRVALRSGVLAGIALAIAEAALLDGVDWLVHGPAKFVAADVRFRLALLIVYPVVVGVVAMLVSLLSTRDAPLAGAYAVLIVIAAHVLTTDPTPSRVAIRAAACVVAFVALAIAGRSRLRPLVARHGGWCLSVVSVLTLGIVFESLADASRIAKLGAIVAVCAVTILCVIAAERLRVPRFALAAAAVCIVAFTLTRTSAPPPSTLFGSGNASTSAPDIVLVTMDTVRADHVSLYGYARRTTPFLEQFAKTASLYRHAFAAGDMTLSSHASMFTGLLPDRHGAHPNASPNPRTMLTPFDGRVRTIAELLRGRGYATAAILANSGYLGHGLGLTRGFDYYDARPGGSFGEGHHGSLRGGVARLAARLIPTLRAPYWRRATVITREALGVAKAARSTGRPLFLFVNYMDAHGPYDPPRDELAKFARRRVDEPPREVIARAFRRMQTGLAPLTDAEREMLVDRYDAGIATIDDSLRNLLMSLNDGREMLVIVTADHGESLGEHGLFDHGNGVYQTAIGVPMLIHHPLQRTPEVRDEAVSGVDVALTVLDAAGARIPSDRDGVPLRAGAPIPSRIVFSESFPTGRWIEINERFRRKEVAAIAGNWKFIARTNGAGELFALNADPAELHGTRAESPLARACAPLLHEVTRSTQALDAETLEQLRSLGYLR